MKRILLLTIAGILSLLYVHPAFSQTLVASYPFNGNANDATGNGNNGTVNGAALTADRFGNAGKAYSFSGGSDVITVADNPMFVLTTDFSASAWVYPVATPPAAGGGTAFTIVSKDANPGNNNAKWIFGLQNGRLAFHSNGPGLGSGEWVYSNLFSLSLNTWYHCAFSKSGNNVTFYLNGNTMGTFTLPSASVNPSAPLTIGFSEAGLSTTGKIDEVHIYNYSINASGIYTDYSSSSLVASYSFTGNAGDASGNGNNGTVNGATLTADRFGNANSAYSFNGSSSYIDVANSVSLQLSNSYTLSAWVKPNSFYSGSCQANFILAKGNQASEGHYNLQYGDFLDGSCGTFTPSNENFACTIRKGATDQSVYENPNTLPVAPGNWYYVVCTYDGTTQKLYVNGKLRASNTTSGSFGTLNAENLFIGKSNDASGYFISGIIDDVNIYNVPLNATAIFDTYVNDIKKPGSGNALQFVRTADVNTCPSLNIGSGYSFGSQDFTFESWIKKDEVLSVPGNLGRIIIVGESNNGWAVGLLNGGELFLSDVGNSGQGSGVVCIDPNDLNWHHIAVVFQSNNVKFYTDGILKSSVPYTASFNGTGDYSLAFRQSFKPFAEQNFSGRMDEVRIWKNIALSQSAIRDWMCRKINAAHPAYSDLVGYFRCDEGSGVSTGGYNGKFGSFVNNASLNWLASGAALGNTIAHDFVNTTKTANISASTGENFSVTSASGNPDGITVYHIDEAPNSNTGANNGGNNKYFGVFQSGGTAPQYTGVYNYTGNPFVNAGNEANLRLAKRADNSITAWTQMSVLPNTTANTISVTGESTEYILGDITGPLPATLILFSASKGNNRILLNWVTENEINLKQYQVEKSTDGRIFTTIGTLYAKGYASNTYNTADINPASRLNYYRLKIIDKDGVFRYSNVIKTDYGEALSVNILPNPAHDYLIVTGAAKFETMRLFDMSGKAAAVFSASASNIYRLNNLAPGLYMLQLESSNEKRVYKIMIQ